MRTACGQADLLENANRQAADTAMQIRPSPWIDRRSISPPEPGQSAWQPNLTGMVRYRSRQSKAEPRAARKPPSAGCRAFGRIDDAHEARCFPAHKQDGDDARTLV